MLIKLKIIECFLILCLVRLTSSFSFDFGVLVSKIQNLLSTEEETDQRNQESNTNSGQMEAGRPLPSESQMLVISGKGTMAQVHGDQFGQYEYIRGHKYYKQMTVDEDDSHNYLYRHPETNMWLANSNPFETFGWLENSNGSVSVPSEGWEYYDFDSDSYKLDNSINITMGRLEACDTVIIEGEGNVSSEHPEYLGRYIMTEEMFNGRPAWFSSESGGVLYCSQYFWSVVSSVSGDLVLRAVYGSPTALQLHPTQVTDWEYWRPSDSNDQSQYISANIKISCS